MDEHFIEAEMPRLGRVSLPRTAPHTADAGRTRQAQDSLRWYCRRQWSRLRPLAEAPPPIATEDLRSCHIGGAAVRRLVVTLRPAGCGWGSRGGGCVMCGHYLASTGRALASHEVVSQWPAVVDKLVAGQIPVLCVYNGGNALNPDEVDFDGLLDLGRRLADLPFFRRLVLETRPEFAKPDRIALLLDCLAPSQSLMLGIGVETANETVRQLCLNKGLAWGDFKEIPRGDRCLLRFYCFFGAPFLTEAEMLADTFDSLLRFRQAAADEIHVESATIQRGTFLNRLWRNDAYDLPSLWSLVFLLRALPGGPYPYVGAFHHFPVPYQVPTTCNACESRVLAAFQMFNETLDTACFDALECPCLDSWWQRLQESDPRPLEERILSCFEGLNHAGLVAIPAES